MSADVFCHGNVTVHPGCMFQITLSSRAETDGSPILALRLCSNSDMLLSV